MSLLNNFFPQEIISSIGWTLFHSLWQGGIIAVILYITLYLVRNKSANLKVLLSTASLLLLIVTAIVTYNIEYSSAVLNASLKENSLNDSGMSNPFDNHGNISYNMESANLLSKAYAGFESFFSDNINIIFAIWIAGLILFAVRFFGGLFYLARIRSKVSIVKDAYWNNKITIICKK